MRLITIAIMALLLSWSVNGQQKYVFYLHGAILEEQGPKAISPRFGAYEYEDILNAFRKENFKVISEVRPQGTVALDYARKITRQVDSLIKTGVKPGNITVIGASKGAFIALYVSSFLRNKDVSFIILAGCFSEITHSAPTINLCGNILSIYEKSDDIGLTCGALRSITSNEIPHYKEIELNTGLQHGFLFKPLPVWVAPSVKWIKGNYE